MQTHYLIFNRSIGDIIFNRSITHGDVISAPGLKLVFTTANVLLGGHYEDCLSASGTVFTVEHQSDGSWQVT